VPYSVKKPADMKSMKEKLQKTYKNISDTAARQAIHVWNSVMEESDDEGRAWASVYAALNKRGLGKKAQENPMSRTLAASDRKTLIRLASSLEKGSPERRAILSSLREAAPRHLGPKITNALGRGLDKRRVRPDLIKILMSHAHAVGRPVSQRDAASLADRIVESIRLDWDADILFDSEIFYGL